MGSKDQIQATRLLKQMLLNHLAGPERGIGCLCKDALITRICYHKIGLCRLSSYNISLHKNEIIERIACKYPKG